MCKSKGDTMKKRINRNQIFCLIFGIFLFVCFGNSVRNLSILQNNHVKIILYEENQSQYTGAYVREVLRDNENRENSVNATFWGSQGKDLVTGIELGRSQSCEILAVCGNTQNLYPSVPALFVDDKSGCLISESVALKLFGDTNVRGLSVKYGGHIFIVQGVIAQKHPIFIYETSSETVKGLNHVAVNQEHNVGLVEPDREFMSRYGEGISYDFTLLNGCLKCLIGSIIICIIIFFEKIVITWYHKEKRVYKVILMNVGITMVIFCIILFFRIFEISFSGFPAVWSDFDAWREMTKLLMEKNKTLLTEKVEPFQYIYWISFLKSIFWNIGSICCILCIKVLCRNHYD